MTKKQELAQEKKRVATLVDMVKTEREKIAGYEQIARLHSAYISILLKKLGATEDNMVAITGEEIKEALESYEARAVQVDGGYSLYCEITE